MRMLGRAAGCFLVAGLWTSSCYGGAVRVRCDAGINCAPPETVLAELDRSPLRASSLVIASWNIENLSPRRLENARVLAGVAETIRRFDLVAVQELRDVDDAFVARLDAAIRGPDVPVFEHLISERTGQQADDVGDGQEQYGIWWRKDVLTLVDPGALFPDLEDHFQHEPHAARFRTVAGDLDFTVVVFHAEASRAPRELRALGEVVDWTRARFADEEIIVLGDFNADCRHADPLALDDAPIRGAEYLWIVPDVADTRVGFRDCALDRIVVTDALGDRYVGAWGVLDGAFDPGDVELSDHWPVWAAFRSASP